ncbi:sucrase ferredoxin [Frankia sp. CNm7]|uniref:Sucrase ferredoxin n=2 Tax=Frankia nepalensis TaxID=1836974 RepID=A0A937R7B7_9ACTN|nr:sucrase ferredoxin [Frankia nepalensis]MBL7511552.1 sucrase ferredoxin [Frankia nepalensis]MBL7521357.1 sucrase ferredoxin [Frankia nepalensis]MBL7626646.1 sucrase ferredoxin [Frankia nepalensis]
MASAGASFRCAPWTRAQGADPIGTALVCDLFVLIETPPPWPEEIGDLPLFAELGRRGLGARLLAVRPPADAVVSGAAAELVAGVRAGVGVTIWRRSAAGGFTGTDHVVPDEHLADGITRLVREAPADEGWPAPPEVLLCGHGSRDSCCGRLGTRLALDAAADWPDLRVRRCSHTGGHRFAPTGFTLPDGLAWGFLDAETLDTILRRDGKPPLRGHYRGTTALDMWAQVTESALFERFGWSWLDHRITSVSTQVAPDRRSADVRLAWDGPSGPGLAESTVENSRTIPVLVCGEPPENAKKAAPEKALRTLTIHTSG